MSRHNAVNDGHRRPGRPPKFGRPSRVVALTLPEDTIDRLRRVHRDLGWAIVKVLDSQAVPAVVRRHVEPDVELVAVADRRFLIVVNRETINNLPGVSIVPLSGNRAFLALDIGRGLADLELAVNDRLEEVAAGSREHQPLASLRSHLKIWRKDASLRFHTRAIIVVEHLVGQSRDHQSRDVDAPARPKRSARLRAARSPR